MLAALVRVALPSLLIAACGASSSEPRYDPALEGLSILDVRPGVVLPGSTIQIRGRSFVGQPWGTPRVHVQGTFDNGDEVYDVNFDLLATFVDLETLELRADDDLFDLLGSSSGEFSGELRVDIDSAIDLQVHSSAALASELSFQQELTPTIGNLSSTGALFVNDKIAIEGQGLLLGDDEGTTFALVEGCFDALKGGGCQAIEPHEVPLVPDTAFSRQAASFAFVPEIVGIEQGRFQGRITLRNRHASGIARDSAPITVNYELSEAALFALTPSDASLGQFLEISGGGFVALSDTSSTLLEMSGQFTPEGGRAVDVDILLVPDFVEGRRLRYPLNEDDTLGQLIDLRYTPGRFSGQLVATTSYQGTSVSGQPLDFAVDLRPVKQVVYLNFTAQYLDGLRAFGLRAMDAAIRERVAQVVRRDYRSINLEVRLEEPDDFSLYSTVEIGGADPNGLGLLGYDNTPGKDSGNVRLHDTIGGINATTQQDGFPGYGGVFVESLFVFSKHPGDFAPKTGVGQELFDDVFDPLRPDRGGAPVRAADLVNGIAMPTSGLACPASDRSGRIQCGMWALANLIGTTISHEIGHSLGLANPDGGDFHHLSDAPNRLMDSGSSRSFAERAELSGSGPGQFCDEAYLYLRTILPSTEPEELANRPTCF